MTKAQSHMNAMLSPHYTSTHTKHRHGPLSSSYANLSQWETLTDLPPSCSMQKSAVRLRVWPIKHDNCDEHPSSNAKASATDMMTVWGRGSGPMHQYCLIVNWTILIKLQWIWIKRVHFSYNKIMFKNVVCKMAVILFWPPYVRLELKECVATYMKLNAYDA